MGIESDQYYQNAFLQNVDSSETTSDKTERIKKENAAQKDLFQLDMLLDRPDRVYNYFYRFFLLRLSDLTPFFRRVQAYV